MSALGTAAAGGATGVVLATAWWFRPRPDVGDGRRSRIRRLVDVGDGRGSRIRRLVVVGDGRGSRIRGLVVVGGAVLAGVVVGPPVGGVLAVAGLLVTWWRPRRRVARRRAAVAAALPDAADLLAASLEAGRPVTAALRETQRWAPEVLRAQLATLVDRLDAGWRRADALDAMVADLGPDARSLASALLAADRYGVPVAEAVRRLVDDMRRRRRLTAEAAARRLPVRLAIPLVVAVLPAFGLLTILPLLLAALRGLGADTGP